MAADVSVTRWLEQLRAGKPAAAEVLFCAYFERLRSAAGVEAVEVLAFPVAPQASN
jgi:hypothetical protein